MAIPDNDVRKLYAQINELRGVVTKYEGRLTELENYIVKFDELGKRRDIELKAYFQSQSNLYKNLAEGVEMIFKIVKGFLP